MIPRSWNSFANEDFTNKESSQRRQSLQSEKKQGYAGADSGWFVVWLAISFPPGLRAPSAIDSDEPLENAGTGDSFLKRLPCFLVFQ